MAWRLNGSGEISAVMKTLRSSQELGVYHEISFSMCSWVMKIVRLLKGYHATNIQMRQALDSGLCQAMLCMGFRIFPSWLPIPAAPSDPAVSSRCPRMHMEEYPRGVRGWSKEGHGVNFPHFCKCISLLRCRFDFMLLPLHLSNLLSDSSGEGGLL